MAGDASMSFAAPVLVSERRAPDFGSSEYLQLAQGFPNLGNTCYINAVTQCLLHCTPFRQDLERQTAGTSFMGDRLRYLWDVYRNASATRIELLAPLAA